MTRPDSKEAIFFAALERPTAAGRAAFLDGACGGDAGLRGQLDRLLAAHPQVGGFLERPVAEAAGVSHALADSEGPDGLTLSGGPSGDPAARAGGRGGVPLDFLGPPGRPDSLGRLGHYEVLEVLGSGGMGIVFRAFDEALHRVVAVKALAPALAAAGEARLRFVREARSAASVLHDNVVAIHAVDDAGPVPYLVMHVVEGRTLQQRLDSGGPLPVAEAVRVGAQIAAGLAAAHAQGLVHRDIKPANVLLEGVGGRVKITDFGLAQAAGDAAILQPGLIAGTPAYMSPEQAAGRPVDPRSDLFSLGSVLYALCTGRRAFQAPTTLAVLARVRDDSPPPLREGNPDVPAWLEALVAGLHAKDPAARPQTAAEVAELLDRHLAESRQADALGLSPPAPTRGVRSRWRPVVAAAALVAAGLGLAEAAGVTGVRGAAARLLAPPTEAERWEASVALLPAEQQAAAVGARLKELNPDFDGKVNSTVEQGEVTRLQFPTERVSDISPVRALRKLRRLDCRGPRLARGGVSDLSPLRGLPLETLDFSFNEVGDLGPLRGMPLESLICGANPVSDLAPLEGMRLESLRLQNTLVSDLAPLRGMPLRWLDLCQATRVSQLGAIAGMPLEYLNLAGLPVTDLAPVADRKSLKWLVVDDTRVTNLSPLRGLGLTELSVRGTRPADLAPLRGLPLRRLRLDYRPECAEFVRSFPDLEAVNDKPVAEFWKGVAAK